MADASDLRQRIIDGANNIMEATVEQAMEQLVDAWNAVTKTHTGNPHLPDTKFVQQVGDAPRISWRIGFTAPQGEWLEEGVDPHTLGAGSPDAPGSVRHWVDDAGEDIFRRYTGWEVDLPPRPWFNPTLDEIWPGIVAANVDAAGW